MRRHRTAIIVVVGVLVALAVPTTWWLTHRVESVGSDRAAALTSAPASSAVPTPEPDAPTVPPVAAKDASIDKQTASPTPPAPTGVRIPALSVDAPVVPVGVAPDSSMEIPEDVQTIGWYRFGAAPGATTGSAVLAGHVDDKVQGLGAFHDISTLEPGDRVEVTRADGSALAYRVVAREEFDKGDVPWSRVFDRGGSPRIVLITCGGSFDATTGNYVDNIIVTAVPVGGAG